MAEVRSTADAEMSTVSEMAKDEIATATASAEAAMDAEKLKDAPSYALLKQLKNDMLATTKKLDDDATAYAARLDAAAVAAIAELEKEAAALRFTIARHEDFEKYSEVTLTALRAAIKEAMEAEDFDACAAFEARISELPVILDEFKDHATAKELVAAGLTAEHLRSAAMWTAEELKKVGFTASEMKEGGFTAREMMDAKFSLAELKAAKFSAGDLKAVKFFRAI